jgi:hypothetical protein
MRPAQRVIRTRLRTSISSVQGDGEVSCEASEILVSVFCPLAAHPTAPKCAQSPTIGFVSRKP